jgi:hypothetical protein
MLLRLDVQVEDNHIVFFIDLEGNRKPKDRI